MELADAERHERGGGRVAEALQQRGAQRGRGGHGEQAADAPEGAEDELQPDLRVVEELPRAKSRGGRARCHHYEDGGTPKIALDRVSW